MSSILRGGKNAFRNAIRTVSVALIVGLSIGLALVMVLSVEAVQLRIDGVKQAIGSRITISPAGSVMGVGGMPLTSAELGDLKGIPHVTRVIKTMSAQIAPHTDSNLASSIQNFSPPGGSSMGAVTMPLFGTGTDDIADAKVTSGHPVTLTAGTMIDPTQDSNTVLVGKGIADKNGLGVGSTFRAYSTTVTVAGIFSTGNMWADNVIYFPLASLERISSRPDQVSMVYVEVDSADNIASVRKTIQSRVGQAADLTTTEDVLNQAVGPLQDIERIATQDLIGCLIAGAVIIFLSMLMIVRERRREIGVLKAIGASDAMVVTQFIAEALVLALLGSAVGGVIGALATTPVFNQLVLASKTAAGAGGAMSAGTLAIGFKAGWGAFSIVRGASNGLHATVGFGIVLYGLLVALAVAVLGGAVPAWLIARIRPAEVMRGE
jgi:putative ABC transport system permease protein